MRFLHTSDLQIGKAFRFVDEETISVLRAERFDVITRIGRLAKEHAACAVLVAGDVFDVGHVSVETLLKPIERMRSFPEINWHLIPGNHDAHVQNGPWDRLLRIGLPSNGVVHTTSEPQPLADDSAWVLPAVLTQRHGTGDSTEVMEGTSPRKARYVLAWLTDRRVPLGPLQPPPIMFWLSIGQARRGSTTLL